MAKSFLQPIFHVKITKSKSPPSMAKMSEKSERVILQLINWILGQTILKKKLDNFEVTFASLGPGLALKCPRVLKVELLQVQKYSIYNVQKLLCILSKC